MGRGRNYTVSERAVMAIAIFAGNALEDVNALLKAEHIKSKSMLDERPLNRTSYEMLKHSYFKQIVGVTEYMSEEEQAERYDNAIQLFGRLYEHIAKPRKLSELKDDCHVDVEK